MSNAVYYLSISTFSPTIHLANVFTKVSKKSCLAVTDSHHLAIVWVFIAIVAEELPTKNVSAEQRESALNRNLQKR